MLHEDSSIFRLLSPPCHPQGGSQAHYLLGLRILNMLVSEMNAPTVGRSLTQHRKIAVNFRCVGVCLEGGVLGAGQQDECTYDGAQPDAAPLDHSQHQVGH